MMIFLLISFSLLTFADDLPRWVKQGSLSDSKINYIVCSHDGIDPDEARQIAESKCLSSAAKVDGVNIKLTQKTVQSLTGSDSSEVAEIQPLEANVKCEWTDRYLEKIKDGYRVWLRCKIIKFILNTTNNKFEGVQNNFKSKDKLLRGTLLITTIPKADRLIIIGNNGQRVIEASSNLSILDITNADHSIQVNKIGYESNIFELPTMIKSGEKIQKTVVLQRK
jgi:hypothetical protein